MRVIGIDPGSRITGWAILDSQGRKPKPLACGTLVVPKNSTTAQKLAYLHQELELILEEWSPNVASVELPFHGINAKSALLLAQARGALLAKMGQYAIEVFEYTPATIKKQVAGHGTADKSGVQYMVERSFPELAEPVRASEDLADAVAVALCHVLLAGATATESSLS